MDRLDAELFNVMNKSITDSIEMNTKAVAQLNQNLSAMVMELKEIKTELQAIRRNTVFLRGIR